ncbi:MAG: glycosyltransferase family 4 protein [Bacteroides sp.]|nr:glycosyltransferase family 4 protein [Bacteroides sp.]
MVLSKSKQKSIIVISAINLRMGGGLTILRDCLNYISSSHISKDYRVIALVHAKDIANYPNIEYIEFPKSSSSWLRRLYYEYVYFKRLSNVLKPHLWLSLHDISPIVYADRQAVYMHNPSIVNKIKLDDLKYDKKYIAFSLFYKYLYRINIHSNSYCIVQQNWFREICSDLYSVPKDKFIVANPNLQIQNYTLTKTEQINKYCVKFFYPSVPRPFKNFETLCEAALILEKKKISNITITITLDGTENAYAKDIFHKYKNCSLINFIGLLNKEDMYKQYEETDCLIFTSRLETWGLPISEFLPTKKPMILADEPYAHETSQGAKEVFFYKTNDAAMLAKIMTNLIKGDHSKFKQQKFIPVNKPYANNYEELFKILLTN